MKILILVLVAILFYTAISYGRILYLKTNSGNPEINQSTNIFGETPNFKYIAAGDSTAVGIGASKVTNTYTYKIADAVSKNKSVEYKNIGVSGARTSDFITDQLPILIEQNPDLITISIGANDATHLISKGKILNNYKEIIEQLTNKTKAKIFITNIANFEGANLLPYPFVKLIEYRSKSINPEIIKLETDRVKIINIHDFGWDKYPDKQVTYSLDHFHPSDIGYENWTNAFLDKINN